MAQYPVLLPGGTVTLTNAGAPQATMVAVIVVFIAAVLLVGPSFALLFTLQSRGLLGAGEPGALTTAALAGDTGPAGRIPGSDSLSGGAVLRAAWWRRWCRGRR